MLLAVVTGVDVKTAQSRLGHSDPRMTLAVYAQATTDADRRAAERVGEYFLDPARPPSRDVSAHPPQRSRTDRARRRSTRHRRDRHSTPDQAEQESPSEGGVRTGIRQPDRGQVASLPDVMRILVLGAGFGGLELAATLSESLGGDVDVVLLDQSEGFIFGFSKLDVMFGKRQTDEVFHPYRAIEKPGVRFVQTAILAIDPETKRVETDAGTFEGDVLVVALGADLDPSATPGLLEAGHEFYTPAGAFALREVLASFEGGDVVVGVTSTPFKCPPAPSETALLLHDFLTHRGLRRTSTISLVMPLGVPIPPSPAASEALLSAFDERGIAWYPERLVQRLDPVRKVAVFSDGTEMSFDLFLGVPRHLAPPVVEASGMTVDGWIPVDPLTLETRYRDVYAVGDVTSVGTPKAGVFAEGQASVVAAQIVARHQQGSPPSTYDGRGICYLEFGRHAVGKVDVTFLSGQSPVGALEGPSALFAIEKGEFGSSRIQRWFDRSWTFDDGTSPEVGQPA